MYSSQVKNLPIKVLMSRHQVKLRLPKLFQVMLVLFSCASHAAGPLFYVVRTGDTLSAIAQNKIGYPIFAKDGSLDKLLKLNPAIQDPDLIFPGQRLLIQSSKMDSLAIAKPDSKTQLGTVPRKLASTESLSEKPSSSVETSKAFDEPAKATLALVPKQMEIPHHLLLDAAIGMTTLASTDEISATSATLYSSQDLRIQAGWQQDWSDSFSTMFSVKFRSVDFQPPTSSAKSISNSKQLTTGISLDAKNPLTSKFSLNYGASYTQELFLRGLTSTLVSVDSVAIPKFSLGATYQIYEVGKTSVGLNGNFDYLLGATTDGYTVKTGMAYQGGFFLKRRYGADKSVEVNINYRDRTQNMSIVNLNEKTVFGSLIFSLPLFDESENK